MGHMADLDVYNRLVNSINERSDKVPFNQALYNLIKELFSTDEAELICMMPYSFTRFDKLLKRAQWPEKKLRKILHDSCTKGLVIDICVKDVYHFVPSPFLSGLYGFTMMSMGDTKAWAKRFSEYLDGDDSFWRSNYSDGQKVPDWRTIPHEASLAPEAFSEILDEQRAIRLINRFDKFAIGLCACRHEKLHMDEKECDVPLDTCSFFGWIAEYKIKHGFAREVCKSELIETVNRSRDYGLVLNADNVKNNITFLCQCCKCCCHPLAGIRKYGCPSTVVSSTYIPEINKITCVGCGKCVRACPVDAISLETVDRNKTAEVPIPEIEEDICLGCGVCALKCPNDAIQLLKSDKRVITPASTFERVILQCLERGTLQNQLFDNPESKTQNFARGFVSGFLRLPIVKKAIMSETLGSTFLKALSTGLTIQGRRWITSL